MEPNIASEPALEPDLPIVDAHHHLWSEPKLIFDAYGVDQIIHDKTAHGHNVIATVYVDSHANYRTSGSEAMAPVGESEFAHAASEDAKQRGGRAVGICAGIVPHANLLLGSTVGAVLDAHIAASPRFRGIRHMTAYDEELGSDYGCDRYGVMNEPAFREGFAELVKRDLSFDAWVFHPQLPDVAALARDFPDARIVLDHLGGPIGVGRFADGAGRAQWLALLAEVARQPNVVLKIGSLNMYYAGVVTDGGSEAMAALQRDLILPAIDLFGPSRCMFESNFPVDMLGTGYGLLWNCFKRVTEVFTAAERADLFAGTAIRTYRLKAEDMQAPL